jgi:hypothetical protein
MYYIPTWVPTTEDIALNKTRIVERLRKPLKKKNPWHYYGYEIIDIEKFIGAIENRFPFLAIVEDSMQILNFEEIEERVKYDKKE